MSPKAATAKKQEEEVLVLPRYGKKFVRMRIECNGDSLITHAFSVEAQGKIEDKRQGKAVKKENIDPELEFKRSIHMMPDGKHAGFPCTAMKNLLRYSAGRERSGILAGEKVKGAVHVHGENIGDNKIPLRHRDPKKKGYLTPQDAKRHDAWIRLPSKGADMRYRAEFSSWSMEFIVEYYPDRITLQQLVGLLAWGGEFCGLGEMRPQQNGGPNGRFVLSEARVDE
jgi:hypothetical protein